LLRVAIESVLAQSFEDFELLILDDGSTDTTPQVIAGIDDPRVRGVRHEPSIGMAANWNYGYQFGQGEFVAVLHDDDFWAPSFLEQAVAAFRDTPEVELVYAAVDPVDLDGTVTAGRLLGYEQTDRVFSRDQAIKRFVQRAEIGWPAILARRSTMLELGGFSEDFPFHKDWEVWLRFAARAPVGFLRETLGYYRQHPGQFTADHRTAIGRDRYEMLWATIPTLPLPPAQRALLLRSALRSLAETQLVTAWNAAREGESARARSEARFAVRIDASVLFRSPQMVAAAYGASWLPTPLLNKLDQLRTRARPWFRRR
jgi:hypothetical protein